MNLNRAGQSSPLRPAPDWEQRSDYDGPSSRVQWTPLTKGIWLLLLTAASIWLVNEVYKVGWAASCYFVFLGEALIFSPYVIKLAYRKALLLKHTAFYRSGRAAVRTSAPYLWLSDKLNKIALKIVTTCSALANAIEKIILTIGFVSRTGLIAGAGYQLVEWVAPDNLFDIPISRITLSMLFRAVWAAILAMFLAHWLFNAPDVKEDKETYHGWFVAGLGVVLYFGFGVGA